MAKTLGNAPADVVGVQENELIPQNVVAPAIQQTEQVPSKTLQTEEYEQSQQNDAQYQQADEYYEESAQEDTGKKKNFWTGTSAEDDEVVDETPVTEDVWQKHMDRIVAMYGITGEFGLQDGECTVPVNDPNGMDTRFHEYFAQVEADLASLHAKGEFHKVLDTQEPEFTVRPGVRNDIAQRGDFTAEVDQAVTDKANHQLNLMDEMLKNGGQYTDCKYTDKDGNPLHFDFESADAATATNQMETIMYGIDHGLIKCEMPNGKVLDPNSIGDGYIEKLDYYDSMERAMAFHMTGVEAETANRIADMSPEERDKLIPEYITDPEKREMYMDCANDAIKANEMMYNQRSMAFANGENPYLVSLQNAGANIEDVSYAHSKQASQLCDKYKSEHNRQVETNEHAASLDNSAPEAAATAGAAGIAAGAASQKDDASEPVKKEEATAKPTEGQKDSKESESHEKSGKVQMPVPVENIKSYQKEGQPDRFRVELTSMSGDTQGKHYSFLVSQDAVSKEKLQEGYFLVDVPAEGKINVSVKNGKNDYQKQQFDVESVMESSKNAIAKSNTVKAINAARSMDEKDNQGPDYQA